MDGRILLQPGSTGVATYAWGLRRALALISEQPLTLIDRPGLSAAMPVSGSRGQRWVRALWPGTHEAVACDIGGEPLLVALDIFRLAQVHFDVYRRALRITASGPPGVMHWTYPVPLVIEGWANLYTIHDVIPLLQPDLTPIDHVRHRRLLQAITDSAAAIVTVSDTSAADIARTLGCAADRIHNCGQAVDAEPSSASLPSQLTPKAYLLALGSVERRKNLDRLIDAYVASGATMPLVIAGPDGWQGIRSDKPGVVRLPYLPRELVRALIGQAKALLMPSLAEGFGLPVVEAMAMGTPVMTSRGGALEEIAGNAALLVDPRSIGDMATAIARLAKDPGLEEALSAAGLRNARRFTLARFAEKLAPLYEEQFARLRR